METVNLNEQLKRYFGFDSFKGDQEAIIRNLLGELAEKNLRLNEKLTHMGQRTTRAKLMSYFPPRHSAGAAMNSTFLSPASSLRITLAWSAADCRWSLEKCGMMACSTFTKAILF